MNLVKLPSGNVINAEKILWAVDAQGEIRYRLEGDSDDYVREPNMALDDFLALLHGPAIVDSLVNLDKLKPGSPCQFTYEGRVKHGVIDRIDHSSSEAYISLSSGGDGFTYWPRQRRVTCP